MKNHEHRPDNRSEVGPEVGASNGATGLGPDELLTAYSLGELDGDENAFLRARVEERLATDPAARAELDELRALAGELEGAFGAEGAAAGNADALHPHQRRAIEAALAGGPTGSGHGAGATVAPPEGGPSARLRPWLSWAVPALAAAAVVILAVTQFAGRFDTAAVESGAAREVAIGQASGDGLPGGRGHALTAREQPDFDTSLGALPLDEPAAPESGAPAAGAPELALVTPSTVGGTLEARPVVPSEPAAGALAKKAADSLESSQLVQLEALGYLGDTGGGARAGGSANSGPAAVGRSAPSSTPAPTAAPTAASGSSRTQVAFNAATRGTGAPASPATRDPIGVLASTGVDDDGEALEAAIEGAAAGDRHDDALRLRYLVRPPTAAPGTELYDPVTEAGYVSPFAEPLSTFSIDVDTASYSNVRRFLNDGQLPPKDAVRVEELVNYFRYDYAPPAVLRMTGEGDKRRFELPAGEPPFAVHVDAGELPWAPTHRLVRIALRAADLPPMDRPASHLTFLVDVSGSMSDQDKLPLLVSCLKLLVRQLEPRDKVALVTYAGNAGVALESTACDEAGRDRILAALDRLQSGGSTHGSEGIATAYDIARKGFVAGGTNRVILATDGDFNVGLTSKEALQSLIEDSARSGVFLTVLGFGSGNLKDGTAEMLADKGNGMYAYVDSLDEGRRVLVDQMGASLVTVAKDVKIQVEWNPGKVAAYRLVGYENRALAAQDFNDDRKDAGEIGAGHEVTALYDVVPVGVPLDAGTDPLKYQAEAQAASPPELVPSDELCTVKLRWKAPDSDTSDKIERPFRDGGLTLGQQDPDFRFAAAVAEFGLLLRGSDHVRDGSWEQVAALAESGRGTDTDGWRAEFLRLAKTAGAMMQR